MNTATRLNPSVNRPYIINHKEGNNNGIRGKKTCCHSLSQLVAALRGLVAIAFGALTMFQPGISLAALVLLFGAFAMVDGILGVWTAIAGRKYHENWWVLLLGGLI